jgi:hypothetical protein
VQCFRLTFDRVRTFDLLVEAAHVEDDRTVKLCVGVIYRVAEGARETQPLRSQGGTPIHVYGVTTDGVVRIAVEVLEEVSGLPLASISDCRAPGPLPMVLLGLGLGAFFRWP